MSTKNSKEETIKQATGEAFYEWLSHHPITLGDAIEIAVKQAVNDWLWAHSEEIIERVTGPTSEELRALREAARKEGRPW